nr:hypothetical protein P5626_16570 [Bacillus subtilis]
MKIRGFRIELGEIEAALVQHPQLEDAAVIVHEDQPGDKRLAAYVIPSEETFDTAELRRYAAERLPDYMVLCCLCDDERIAADTEWKA